MCTSYVQIVITCTEAVNLYCEFIVWLPLFGEILINKLITTAITSNTWEFWKDILFVKKNTLENKSWSKPLKYRNFKVSVL